MGELAVQVCSSCGREVDAGARFCPADGTPLVSAQTMSGRLIAGKYQLGRKLGTGGMGQVYLADHVQMKRVCAIKLIRPMLEWDPDSVARFHREAKNASKINHPNVAQIYDFGEADGVTYLAMEYVDGEPLAALLKREGTISPRRTARIVWQTANAVTAAHEHEIVHRDLKPENIMLTKYRTWNDFVKVVDFGIARIVSQDDQVTMTGAFIGTPDYMSPEQFIAPTPDPRSDLYSLALVAVRCLTGSLPPVVGPRVVVVPKDPRDAVGLRTMPVTAQWPEPVKACLCRALAWELSDRYPSPEAFAQELAQVISEWEPPTPGVREPWEGRLSGDHKTPAAAKTLVPARPPEPDRQIAPRAIPSLRLRLLGVSAFGVVAALVGTRLYLTQTGPGALPASIPAFPPSLNPPAPSPPSDSVAPRPASDPVDVPRVVPTAGRGLVLGDSVRQLDRLSDPSSMTAATAREAAELYARIQPELRTNLTRVGAAFFAARALAFLEREREACKILRDHEAMAATVPGYVEAYRASLSLCPE